VFRRHELTVKPGPKSLAISYHSWPVLAALLLWLPQGVIRGIGQGPHRADMLSLVTTGDAQHRWWSCCWGHIFEHGPVAEGDELACPAFFDEVEPCGASFVFEPFASRQEALDAFKPGSPQPQWAPWAANR
jgi:hypothetical protein